MTPRARLLTGAAAGLVSAIVVVAAANATWRIVTPDRVVADVDGSALVVTRERPVKGSAQDGSLSLFAIAGGAAAVLAPMLGAKPRMGASAFLGAAGLMVAAAAALARGMTAIPPGFPPGTDPSTLTFGPPTAAPLIAVAGGVGMIASAAWLLLRARSAPRLSMPDAPPESRAGTPSRDEGAWE